MFKPHIKFRFNHFVWCYLSWDVALTFPILKLAPKPTLQFKRFSVNSHHNRRMAVRTKVIRYVFVCCNTIPTTPS